MIHLDHAEGLTTNGVDLDGFVICGKDQEFVPALVEIEDDKLVVWAEGIREPLHVRYLWDDRSCGNLFNAAGLPASPFRTDDFEMLSANEHF